MQNWHVFQGLFDSINTILVAAIDGITGALITYVAGPMKWAVIFYIAFTAAVIAVTPDGYPMSRFISMTTKAAVVLFLISSLAVYNQFLGAPFLTILPTEAGNAIASSVAGTPVTGNSFDVLWNKGWIAGLIVLKNLPDTGIFPSVKSLVLAGVIGVYWLIAIATIGYAFLIYLASHVLVALLVSFGPLFVACLLFPESQRFFNGWLSGVVSAVLAQLLIVALMSLLLKAENVAIVQIVADPPDANEVGQVQMLLSAGVLFFIAALLAGQLPAIATGIAGGVYHRTGVYSSALISGAGKVINAGTAIADKAKNIGSTGSRATMPVARRSLSGGP